MVVLDTDHLSLLERRPSAEGRNLEARLEERESSLKSTTIITYEEQKRGWMAHASRAKTVAEEIRAYSRLMTHLQSFRSIQVLPFDERAGTEYQRLRRLRLRIGTMDLKIAAIVLAHNATLLSRNLADFRKVPGLKVEDWTIPSET
jgi:tRNA(fMet)-specific endonuclease VapC